MRRPAAAGSLVARLVWLFVVGSAFIMAGAGYALYHALRMQLEASDLNEIRGKAKAVELALRDVGDRRALRSALDRVRELPVGHPRFAVAARSGAEWIIQPGRDLAEVVTRPPGSTGSHGYVEAGLLGRTWLIHTLQHSWSGPEAGSVEVVLTIEITETQKLLREHALVAWLVALLGTAASAVLAWFVARRGLAPISQVAARAGEVTARRLGDRLDLTDAPREIHGLADSINLMLERLEESFRALEQFSADIAHELRTPLNNVLVQTQVTLARTRSVEEYQDVLHSNLEELERLQRMVSDMLFLARADRQMIGLDLLAVDLRPEIESVAEYFEAAAAERGQTIHVQGEGTVQADRLMVRRVMNNLLSNAVRYAPEGAAIEVSIAAGRGGCTVEVTNPSEPISTEELRRLFSRFVRRDHSRGRQVEGVGLGLSIVESIMKLLGGAVDATADGGKVSFKLHFPGGKMSNS